MTLEGGLWLASAACFLAFLILGYSVSVNPYNATDDRITHLFRGRATPVALFFTWTGRALPLAGLAVAALAAFAIAHGRLWIPVAVGVSQVSSQGVVEFLKRVFRRKRPDVFFGGRELGLSYPSGHATTAIVFYGGWLALIARAGWPKSFEAAGVAVLGIWLVAIVWSRLALGAHYLTDIAGGILFGIAWLAALWAIGVQTGLLHG